MCVSSQLKLLSVAAFFNALSWIILIPIWQYPDEQAHFAQVQDVAELGSVPKMPPDTSLEIALSEEILGTTRDEFGNNKFTYHPEYKLTYAPGFSGPQESAIASLPKSARTQLVKREATLNPPLYYFVGAFSYKLFYGSSLSSRVYAARFVSAIFFLTTIALSYQIGSLIFAKNKILPLVLVSLVAFKPMMVFASTGVLPDTLTNFLFTLILFFSLKILSSGLTILRLLGLIVVLILGILTRQQFIIAIPIVSLPIVYQLIKNWRRINRPILMILSLVVLVIFWSFFVPQLAQVRSRILAEMNQPNLILIFNPKFLEHIGWTINHSIAEVLPWYWGVYKWLSLTVPHINYQVINRIIALALLGLIIRFFLIFKNKRFTNQDLILLFMIFASAFYFLVFLIWDYFFRLRYGYSFGIQGRYFFPLVVAHLSILLMGLFQIFEVIFKRYAKLATLMIVFLMIIFNDVSLAHVSSSYYDTSSFTTFVNQASQYKPVLFKGNIILAILLSTFILQSLFLLNLAKYISAVAKKRT